jgi:hypothetical protein
MRYGNCRWKKGEMARDAYHPFEYDVALSFAPEDRDVAERFAELLIAKEIRVLSEEYEADKLGGGDFVTYVAELYRTKAWCCILFISQHYPLKKWTEAERTSAQEHALRDAAEYILPFRLDETDAPGVTETPGYRDLRQGSPESIVDWLEGKLAEIKDRSRPPSGSHDLRSGNVPLKRQGSDDK